MGRTEDPGNITLTGDVTSVGEVTTISAGAVDIAMLSATGTPDGTTFLRGDNTWSVPGGSGDMVLATVQTSTGKKTFAADATLAGFNLNDQTPSAPVDGDIYRSGNSLFLRGPASTKTILTNSNSVTITNKEFTDDSFVIQKQNNFALGM